MKQIVAIFTALVTTAAFGAERELTFKTRADGQPNFGIQYAYDVDSTWAFTFATTITSATLAALPTTLAWSVVNAATGQPMTTWKDADKSQLVIGALELNENAEVAKVLPNLKSAKVVFGVRGSQGAIEPLFSIPIGPLCQNYPGHFMDLTHPSKAACS